MAFSFKPTFGATTTTTTATGSDKFYNNISILETVIEACACDCFSTEHDRSLLNFTDGYPYMETLPCWSTRKNFKFWWNSGSLPMIRKERKLQYVDILLEFRQDNVTVVHGLKVVNLRCHCDLRKYSYSVR